MESLEVASRPALVRTATQKAGLLFSLVLSGAGPSRECDLISENSQACRLLKPTGSVSLYTVFTLDYDERLRYIQPEILKMARNTFTTSRPRNESQKSAAAQPQSSSKTKSSSPSSQRSITRRNSAPLLGAFGSNDNRKVPVQARPKIDTSLTYQRPGMSPINKSATPNGQFSTFGTPYNASWETSRSESIHRPSTAPLPDDDDDLVGGVHYTTYGSRNSQVYEAPFSDISVPVPPELIAQAEHDLARSEKEKGKGHRRSGSALLRMVGVEPVAPEAETQGAQSATQIDSEFNDASSIQHDHSPGLSKFLRTHCQLGFGNRVYSRDDFCGRYNTYFHVKVSPPA
ncbi:hypothetical protein RHS01_10001 [Rhizoctonia solani]|uniref:Uncharacterized protein n=1 Tax=Rhizoctonia solani TaxID=456999 RepID=A0A8H7I2R6_9AGAM|nr:hypothetical protein RHS01_10001 [Rhizoctonia solani]